MAFQIIRNFFFFIFFLSSGLIQAQIQLFQVNKVLHIRPNEPLDSLEVEITGDSIRDVVFREYGDRNSNAFGFNIGVFNGGGVVIKSSQSIPYTVKRFNEGAQIDGEYAYNFPSLIISATSLLNKGKDFNGKGISYIGFSLKVNDSTFNYGLVQAVLNVKGDSLGINWVALELEPNKKITASKTLGLNPNENINVKVFPNPVHELLFIEGLSYEDQIKILDLSGRVLLETDAAGSDRISIKNQGKGFRILQIFNKQKLISSQLVIFK